MSIYMLDLDPFEAAGAHADADVERAFKFAVQQLANAWHELYSNWSLPPDAEPLEHDVVKRVVSDAAHPRPLVPLRTYQADGPVRPGDPVVWTLMGQRIPQKANETHASGLWVRQLGGNYRWTQKFAYALGWMLPYPAHPDWVWLRRSLLTMEALPPPLQDTETEWSEAPLTMPNIFRQERDGFYDSVASWRLYYGSKYGSHSYKHRPPKWLEEANAQAEARIAHGEA